MAKRAGDSYAPGEPHILVGYDVRLRRRRTHAKLDRSLDHGEGLSLTVHKPSAIAPVSLILINSASTSLSLSCCPHFRRVHSAAPWMPRRGHCGRGRAACRSAAPARRETALPSRTSPAPGSTPDASRSRGGTGWRPSTVAPGRVSAWRWGRSGRVRRQSVSDRHPGDSAS